MRKILPFLSLTTLIGFNQAFAQSTTLGGVKGFVYEKETGEALSSTNIFVKDTKTGAQTDENGYFAIGQLSPGTYTLFATSFGYDTAFVTVKVEAGQFESKKFFLESRGLELKGVDISARKIQKTTRVNIGTTTITPKEIKLLPSSGGEPDLAQYLQVTPGVTFTGDQGGQLYIRGGSPVQTGILLDGITIYNPFHSIGLYSVFETEAIRSADVYTAGFNATYGNRSSAIVDVHTKDGNNQRIAGVISASPIMVRGMLEGPLMKQKTPESGSSTFLISAKHSYLSQTSEPLYSSLGEEFKNGLPFEFTDLYGKVTFSGNNGSKFNLFGFNFRDKAKVFNSLGATTAQFDWNSYGAGTTFVVSPSGSSSLINGKFAYSSYKINNKEINFTPRSSSINNFEGAIDFTYFLPAYSQLNYGIEVAGQSTKLDYKSSIDTDISTLSRNNTTAAAFFVYKKNFNQHFILEPSIRFQYYSSQGKFSPEPRINLKYNITSNLRFKAAAGLYSQNIVGIKSDRDIVNFFNGFVLSPDEKILNTDREAVNNNLEMAQHVVAGVEFDIQDVEINIEPWYKNFSQIIQLNRTKDINGTSTANFQADKGKAAGLDISAKYVVKRVFLWGVVSYQKIEYTTRLENFDGSYSTQNYAPPFDRRLNINLVGSYTFGKKKNLEFSVRFNYGSPFPFTQTQGFNENVNVTGNISGNILSQNGSLNTIYASTINGGRLTPFHRLDMSVKKTFKLSTYSTLETTFAMTNVYDRNNIFYVNRIENKVYYQLPVFPSLNVSWRF
ncbi:MAG: carboxypeptidase-like regulatory domain-containing protein [Chitinophagaceae bacterium]|jgi:hypothetical protein